jgi:carboxyl-terminal processing protease
MVAGLGDRWSRYMDRETYASYMEQMTNSYVGVGITVQLNEEGQVLVLRVEAGGPAEEAGVQPGDLVLTVGAGDIYRAGEALLK